MTVKLKQHLVKWWPMYLMLILVVLGKLGYLPYD
jgi:hypothetical protein